MPAKKKTTRASKGETPRVAKNVDPQYFDRLVRMSDRVDDLLSDGLRPEIVTELRDLSLELDALETRQAYWDTDTEVAPRAFRRKRRRSVT